MANGPHELAKALPDQVTTARLREARLLIAGVCEVNAASVDDSVLLAKRLRGVSQAVTDIVVSRGAVEVMDLSTVDEFDPTLMPALTATNIVRRFSDPSSRTGRMFVAHASRGYGASMAVDSVVERGYYDIYETPHRTDGKEYTCMYSVDIPTDEQVETLLSQEPCFWADSYHDSRDHRGEPPMVYPFHSGRYTEGAPQRYFATLQELSTELLAVTA